MWHGSPCDRMHYGEDKETIDLIFSRCASSSTLPFPSSLLCAALSKDPHLLYASSPDAWRGAALKRSQVMDAIPLVSHHSFCIVSTQCARHQESRGRVDGGRVEGVSRCLLESSWMLWNKRARCSDLCPRRNEADGQDSQGPSLQMTPILEAMWGHLQPSRSVRTSSAGGAEVRSHEGGVQIQSPRLEERRYEAVLRLHSAPGPITTRAGRSNANKTKKPTTTKKSGF